MAFLFQLSSAQQQSCQSDYYRAPFPQQVKRVIQYEQS
ncbi:hypothetical protein FHR87_003603 [Azomonas macrocytogenes]|uniref:Uncharacterized protein n=1 Tax=Azomonas macrocytogenes TaxID=69962 RepID=A0A839T7V3_AZOMA|nr:hypothetical protein [Azomonas macrocytogenes]